MGICIRGLMKGMAALTQGNQEPLVVKAGKPSGVLGASKAVECDIFPSVLRHCWVVDRKGIQPVKHCVFVSWW